jgi:hypothetical protein
VTLIVGILCQDGIVVGSDGAATMGVMGQQTARQAVKKLTLFTTPIPMVLGVSGPVGLAQRIGHLFSKFNFSGSNSLPHKPAEVMTTIRQQLWTECIQPEVKIAAEAGKLFGNISVSDANCASMVALPVSSSRQLTLISFDQQGSPEMASSNLPFVAIGSGQFCADPFLAFIRRIFWPERLPRLSEGIFAAYWTLDHAIKTSPGGIAEPKQIAVLENKDTKTVCRELTADELNPIREAVSDAENRLKELNKASPSAEAIPKPELKNPPAS